MPKFLLTIFLAFLAAVAIAAAPVNELEAKSGETVVRISGANCTNKAVLDNLKPEFRAQFKRAEVRNSGKPTAACWTMDARGVFIMLENGDGGYVPPEAFKPVETI
jgi:hypothetical protein